VANSWFIYTTKSLTLSDIREAAEATLTELLAGTGIDAWKPLRLFSIEGRPITSSESHAKMTSGVEATETEAILRAFTGDQVFLRVAPAYLSFGLETRSEFGTVLALAAAIGVSRRVGANADYGDSVLPNAPATDDWGGHDPEELLATLRLPRPTKSLNTAVRSVLARTVFDPPHEGAGTPPTG
jgi:hypothetical protein